MDQTGLLNRIYTSVVDIYRGRQWLDTEGFEGKGRISYRKGLTLGIKTFREAQSRASDDLYTLFLAEYTFLGQELELCDPKDTKARTSLTKAIQDFDEAFLVLKVL